MAILSKSAFCYDRAFCRNYGWVSEEEQQLLRDKTVAIAGMGGVGGSHLLTLARLGVSRFHICDFDIFEIENFNRQAGANMSSLGRKKTDVLAEMVKDINPEIKIEIFEDGILPSNVDRFLDGADIFLDGLDVFAMDARRLCFNRARMHNVPALTAGPIGMGTALMIFMPESLSFEDYFDFNSCPKHLHSLKFILGLTPTMMQLKYLKKRDAFNSVTQKAPSTPMGCQLASGLLASQTFKILADRPGVRAAPWSLHIDGYLGRSAWTYNWLGARNPIYRLKFNYARRLFPAPPSI